MKKKKITFGVPGMMEYQCAIHFGRNSINVTFSGGSMNAMGVNPATFTTDNFLYQQAIMNSPEFRRGRIVVVKEVDLDGEVKVVRNAPRVLEQHEPDSQNCSDSQNSTEAEAAGKTDLLVEFDNNDDAKDWLCEKYGLKRSTLQNREKIVAAAKEKGVDLRFTE